MLRQCNPISVRMHQIKLTSAQELAELAAFHNLKRINGQRPQKSHQNVHSQYRETKPTFESQPNEPLDDFLAKFGLRPISTATVRGKLSEKGTMLNE